VACLFCILWFENNKSKVMPHQPVIDDRDSMNVGASKINPQTHGHIGLNEDPNSGLDNSTPKEGANETTDGKDVDRSKTPALTSDKSNEAMRRDHNINRTVNPDNEPSQEGGL
jgi:hypothetical protein